MKKFILILLVAGSLVGCQDDDEAPEPEVVNRWILEEILADPGNGSGVFQPVTSDKMLVFLSDSTLMVFNGTLCGTGGQSGSESTATYSLADGTILPNNCELAPGMSLAFEMVDDRLILYYPCIEPCAEKYRPVLTLID